VLRFVNKSDTPDGLLLTVVHWLKPARSWLFEERALQIRCVEAQSL